MKLSTIVSFIILCLNLSCAKNKSRAPEIKYIELGDPMQMVEGATLQKSFSSPKQFQKELQNFSLGAVQIFLEEREESEIDTDIYAFNFQNVVQESQYQFEDSKDFQIEIFNDKLIWTQKQDQLGNIIFEIQSDNSLKATHMIYEGNILPLETLHSSLKDDFSAMTLLVSVDWTSTKKALIYFYYQRNDYSPYKKTFKNYNYLNPEDKSQKIRWKNPQNIKLQLCGPKIQKYRKHNERAVQDWNKLSQVNGTPFWIDLSIKIYDYPPFSDLNTQCIYLVEDYKTRGPEVKNFGTTFIPSNYNTGTIVDADIVFYQSELQKSFPNMNGINSNGESFDYVFKVVATHELGHFLGLGHQFDGEKSIMSYKHSFLHPYDEEAIVELYKD